ncbi:MAG: DUF4345 domain-containing protein [Myxococcota bacterium]
MERFFRRAVAFAAAVAVLVGAVNLIFGAAMHLPPERVTPEVDSQVRFFAVWFLALGPLVTWVLRDLPARGALLRLVFGAMFFGALARAASMVLVGLPEAPMIGATIFEASLVLLLPLQARVERGFVAT